jgi:hypothetical protein
MRSAALPAKTGKTKKARQEEFVSFGDGGNF